MGSIFNFIATISQNSKDSTATNTSKPTTIVFHSNNGLNIILRSVSPINWPIKPVTKNDKPIAKTVVMRVNEVYSWIY